MAIGGGATPREQRPVSILTNDITSDNLQLSMRISGATSGSEQWISQDSTQSIADSGGAVQSIAGAELAPQSIADGAAIDLVAQYVAAAAATSTRRAYRGDIADFLSWGGVLPCPPAMLAAYIAQRGSLHAPATVMRRVVGISRAHTSRGWPDPAKTDLVRAVIRGVRRTHGKPQRQAVPLLTQDLVAILHRASGVKGIRDRALILLGFAAALRRSELVSLDAVDIRFVREGLLVRLSRSKTDVFGEGRTIAVPHGSTAACPVSALRCWLDVAAIAEGPLFRGVTKAGAVSSRRLTDQSVSLIVKANARAVGLPVEQYSGHSLRAGLVTSAAKAGVSFAKLQQQTGHKSVAMLTRYIRDADLFVGNAAGAVL